MANILIVDDAAFMRMMLKNIITELGHTVVGEAGNGQQAVTMYKELNPDLVTMDITMPDVDGIAAVKQIRGVDANAKIIMCSAMGQQALVLEAIQSGAKDFIVKPFEKDRIREAIARVLSA
ncbi:response regulator [Fodinisporobacter ferrooxydans]|uniref:Response regulator n=1 Tax=Fodinisporobacter ferrooxydans TaxID=2901836 RepID=A0ABY4CM03_9BACL|nr:response regulator [Alicyclobacillaceae bacterium MYW30-H2]